MQSLAVLLFSLFQVYFLACTKNSSNAEPLPVDTLPVSRPVLPVIAEASGMADSRLNKGFLWVHEDSGGPEQLYLLGHDGKVAKTIALENCTNRDWEELQLADGHLYLGDIGDNSRQYKQYVIYRFAEPKREVQKVQDVQRITFEYADGAHDAEAFLIDPKTKDILIITKSSAPTSLYRIPYPYSFTDVNKAMPAGSLSYGGVVSAALSPDAKTVIVKTYPQLMQYTINTGQSLTETLQNPFKKLPYQQEPQGEAVAFAADNSGYFTLSEKSIFNNVSLYFYKWR